VLLVRQGKAEVAAVRLRVLQAVLVREVLS